MSARRGAQIGSHWNTDYMLKTFPAKPRKSQKHINKKQYAINGVYLKDLRKHQLDTWQVCIADNKYHISIAKIAQFIDIFSNKFKFLWNLITLNFIG